MAVYLKNNLLLAWLAAFLLLLVSTTARFSAQVSEAEISAICSKAKNPKFCLEFLKLDPQAAKADLPGLAKLTIDSARKSASHTLTQIQSLVKKATDPHSKEVYTSCSENYGDAISAFDDALKSLAARDPGSLNIQVSAAMEDADTCQGDLKSVSPDPSLVKKIGDLENVCSIVLVISNMLPK